MGELCFNIKNHSYGSERPIPPSLEHVEKLAGITELVRKVLSNPSREAVLGTFLTLNFRGLLMAPEAWWRCLCNGPEQPALRSSEINKLSVTESVIIALLHSRVLWERGEIR